MLTGSLSWNLESPYLFDHFEVATWCGYDMHDGAPGAKVVAIFDPCVQTPLFSELDGRLCLGSASSFGCETHPLSRRASFVPRRLLDMYTTGNNKILDYLSKIERRPNLRETQI